MPENVPQIHYNTETVESDYERQLADLFNNEETALKIRKIELLEEVGLPIPKQDIIDPLDFNLLKETISRRQSEEPETPLIVRFACVPDKISMPTIFIETDSNIDDIIKRTLVLIGDNKYIKKIILQDLTPEQEAKNKISGRYLLENSQVYPREEVLELYKGSRSTNILNNPDVTDPNFMHFEKQAGKFMTPNKDLSGKTSFTESELRSVYSALQELKDKLIFVRSVIAASKDKKPDDVLVSFEFSYCKGKLVFSDID